MRWTKAKAQQDQKGHKGQNNDNSANNVNDSDSKEQELALEILNKDHGALAGMQDNESKNNDENNNDNKQNNNNADKNIAIASKQWFIATL